MSEYVAPPDACTLCKERGKTWQGSDPRCAYPNDGAFVSENWSCATDGLLREVAYEAECSRVPLPYGMSKWWHEDQNYFVALLDGMYDGEDDGEPAPGDALWLSWYKHRGQTMATWLLDAYGPPRTPTAAETKRIAEYLSAKLRATHESETTEQK